MALDDKQQADLEAKLADVEKTVQTLTTERDGATAQLTVAQNAAKDNNDTKTVAALQQVLKAHNITVDLTPEQLAKLTVDDKGAVTGEIGYTPSTATTKTTSTSTNSGDGSNAGKAEVGTTGMSAADVAKMTPAQINENWSAVQEAMKGSFTSS